MTSNPIQILDASRIARLPIPYAARRFPRSAMATLRTAGAAPAAGDLVLVRIDRLGQHRHLELATGRRARLFPGDEIVLVYGNRYAPDQFEAVVPDDLGPCHMVAGGGLASRVLTRHTNMKGATAITPLGLVADRNAKVLNLAQFALGIPRQRTRHAHTVAVVGTSMNAGKTETATHIIRGLSSAGMKVGAAKVTGTGAGGDAWSMLDAGAAIVLDFGDAGMASTYLASSEHVEQVFTTLTRQLYEAGMDAVVLEVADGLYQRETAALLTSRVFAATVHAIVFAAGDAMGSLAGVQWLLKAKLPVVAASGLLTASPLASREAQAAHGLPVLGLNDLAAPSIAQTLNVAPAQVLSFGEAV